MKKILTFLLLVLGFSISTQGQDDLFRSNDLGPWNSLLMFDKTFGVAIFERWLNSDVYTNDIGIQLEAGIKF